MQVCVYEYATCLHVHSEYKETKNCTIKLFSIHTVILHKKYCTLNITHKKYTVFLHIKIRNTTNNILDIQGLIPL